jgi:hypothetical protein
MAESTSTPPPNPEPAPKRNLFEVIFESALEALSSAFLVYILGGVALSIAGSFAGEMIPSAPPGVGGWEHAKSDHSIQHEGWWDIEGNGPLICIFVIFFAHSLWVNFRNREAALGKRTARILANLRENWFSIIIGNAIGAWVATLLMGIVPNFSIFEMVWDWMLGLVFPVIRQAAIFFMGASNTASVGNWLSWYHANNIKLAFWILYLAGTLDDLGVPNVKAVARWTWRRYQKRRAEAAASPVSPSP